MHPEAVAASPTSVDPETTSPGPRRRRWVAAVLGGALGVAVVTVGWVWSHPTVFEPGGGYSVSSDTWTANAPFYAGLTSADPRPRGTVTIHSARPHALSPSEADVAFYVCTIDPAEHVGGILSAGESEIRQQCTSLVPAAGATIDLDAKPFQVLVMAVTPKSPEQLTVHGADVTYSHGWQRGTQQIGGDVEIRTRTP